MRLGAWLLSKGKITEDQLQRALQHQAFFGGRLGSSLIKLGYIDEDVLGAYLSDVSGSPYAPPSLLDNVPAPAVAVVPGRLAAQYRAIPIGIEGRRLRLAMRDPKDLIALDEIAFLTGLTIEAYVATEFRIQRALQKYYEVPTTARSTIPVAAAGSGSSWVAPATASTPSPGAAGPGRDVGFDGYPLDADPEQIANPFGSRPAPSKPAPPEPPPPTSLEEWRMAQEEIPDDIPEAAPPAGPVVTSPGAAAKPSATMPLARPAAEPPPPPATGSIVPPAITAITSPSAAPVQAPPTVDPGTAASSRPAPAATMPAPGATASLEEASTRLRLADSRDEIFEAVLDFTAARFRRCALFIVQAERVIGWSGRGPGIDPKRVRQVIVPLDRPSLFTFFRRGADYYHGPVPDLPANTRFFFDLGCPAPARAFLSPLLIKERPTVIVYADNEAEAVWTPDVSAQRRLLGKAALALEILILKHKISTL